MKAAALHIPVEQRTALLVFSRSAREEASIKQLAPGKNALHVAHDLLDHTRSVAEASGLDVHWFGPQLQKGADFGERIAHAFGQIFALGYARVMCVGNDCPELSPNDLRLADALLHQSPMVLGPSRDQGTYLIGINRQHFTKEPFSSLDWSHGHSLDALKHYASERKIACHLLKAKSDLDQANDWVSVWPTITQSSVLYRWHFIALPGIEPIAPSGFFFFPEISSAPCALRAPPLLAA